LEFLVPPEALGKIIGPKGKTVQTMIEQYQLVNINLEDTGSVQIESFSNEKNAEVMEVREMWSFYVLLPWFGERRERGEEREERERERDREIERERGRERRREGEREREREREEKREKR
jgi:polyribonucleotide nucleotidyltransferase